MELVNVDVACPCPGAPHETDTVRLRPKLGLRAGVSLQGQIVAARNAREAGIEVNETEVYAALTEGYLLHGVAEWTFTDAEGAPIPVTPDTIRSVLLDDFALASPVADRADALYAQAVILPLVDLGSTSLPRSRTNGSTSVPTTPTRKRQKRSRPSSTSTSLTGVTATTSA